MLTITGEHDLSTAPDLGRRLKSLIASGSPVVLDLSRATFIDSSILGAVLDAKRRAGAASLGFSVVNAGGAETVRRVLEVTGLRAALPVHEAREEALAAATDGTGGNSR